MFGQRLKEAAKAKKLSLEFLGVKIGVSKHTVYGWGQHRWYPSEENRTKLCEVLECDPAWLFHNLPKGIEKKPKEKPPRLCPGCREVEIFRGVPRTLCSGCKQKNAPPPKALTFREEEFSTKGLIQPCQGCEQKFVPNELSLTHCRECLFPHAVKVVMHDSRFY